MNDSLTSRFRRVPKKIPGRLRRRRFIIFFNACGARVNFNSPKFIFPKKIQIRNASPPFATVRTANVPETLRHATVEALTWSLGGKPLQQLQLLFAYLDKVPHCQTHTAMGFYARCCLCTLQPWHQLHAQPWDSHALSWSILWWCFHGHQALSSSWGIRVPMSVPSSTILTQLKKKKTWHGES